MPDVNFAGFMADDCCDKVICETAASAIPLIDDMSNCDSCWVYQEPLEPVITGDCSRKSSTHFHQPKL